MENDPPVMPTPSLLARAGVAAGRMLLMAKWLWSIPFIKSVVATRLAQAGIVGALAMALSEKVIG